VSLNRRPKTYALYEMIVRADLKPALGKYPLTRLSASRVQAFLNGQLAAGRSVRRVQIMRTVLSSALTRAMREELVVRNVARLAELPTWERKPITPWTAAEARASSTPQRATRSIPHSSCCSFTVFDVAKCSACAGATSTKRTAKSASASRSSVSTENCDSARSRPVQADATSPYCRLPPTHL
jgi:Phage integrase, N-terminal SAM-like domain